MIPGPLRRIVPRPVRLRASGFLARRRSSRLARELASIAASGIPIVAGPWLGEVGSELLYWAPFLAWFAERFEVGPERLLVVSRGGTASWYRPFAARYADAFDHVSPEQFKAQHDTRVVDIGEQKQTRVTGFERDLLAAVATDAGIRQWHLPHPSAMHDVLNPFWWDHLPIDWVQRHTRYRRLMPPSPVTLPSLPASYVAVKFYFNDCFPATPANRAWVREKLARLSHEGAVVSLATGLRIDDHDGCRVDDHGVMHLPEGIPPSQNLQVQSAVVAGARAFAGTYGGFSYLAPLHGVRSTAYYSDPKGFSRKHLAVAQAALASIGGPILLDVHGID